MPNLLADLYQKAEILQGRRLIMVLSLIFVVFLLLGVGVGYLIPQRLNKSEEINEVAVPENVRVTNEQQYEGKVVYVDPGFYPLDKVSYYLEEPSTRKKIILLDAKDEKLAVVEGLEVVVFGETVESKGGEGDILIVDKIIVKNSKNR